MGVNKSRNPLSYRVMRSNNEATKVIRFMDFGEEIEDGGARFGDMKEGDI